LVRLELYWLTLNVPTATGFLFERPHTPTHLLIIIGIDIIIGIIVGIVRSTQHFPIAFLSAVIQIARIALLSHMICRVFGLFDCGRSCETDAVVRSLCLWSPSNHYRNRFFSSSLPLFLSSSLRPIR
jgi:hypothetical protein